MNIFPTFRTKKSKMECKNITSLFIKVIQRKKEKHSSFDLKSKYTRRKKTGVLCYYAFIKVFYLSMISKQKVNSRVLFHSNFSYRGYSPTLAKIN